MKLKKLDKNYILVAVLTGVLLLVITLPTKEKEESVTTQEAMPQQTQKGYQEQLEESLEKILGSIKGVGNVQVMITLKDNGTYVVEKDMQLQQENDRVVKNEETIYEKSDTPFVKQQQNPQVKGVLVVAQGAGNTQVKEKILDVILALFSIEAHNIIVVEMK